MSMKRIITDYEEVNSHREIMSYKLNWLHNICKLPAYEGGNYQIYTDVCIRDMEVKNSPELEDEVAEDIREGQRMMFLICENDRAVLGLMYCSGREEQERNKKICSSYLQDFPVIPFHRLDFHRYKVCFPPILEEIEKILEEDAKSPKEKKVTFRTFPIDADKNSAIDYVKAHMLTLSKKEDATPKYVYFPSKYGNESGVVRRYSIGNKYHEVRITERGRCEMQKNVSYQNGDINVMEDFSEVERSDSCE